MEVVIKTSTQFHNCAFHVLVPYITAFFSPKAVGAADFQFREIKPTPSDKVAFQKTEGYKAFLAAFAQYYKIENNAKLPSLISELLEKHPHPLDLQVLLGPVLRLTLKTVLENEKKHKTSLKESFRLLLNECARKYNQHGSLLLQSEAHKIAWLSQIKWKGNEEFEELFRPNIGFIAKKLGSKKIVLSDKDWDRSYQNYCDYQCSPERSIYVSADQLSLLCTSFNFDLQLKEFIKRQIFVPQDKEKYLASVLVKNKSRDHWELIGKKGSNWDYTKESAVTPAIFGRYHELSRELVSLQVSHQQIALLQNTFRDKIHKLLTGRAEFKEDFYAVLPSENWANNGGMEGIIALISENVHDEDFQKTPGFKQFIQTFRQYYGLKANVSFREALLVLNRLLRSYPIPQERFMLFSPLLRKMLGSGNLEPQNLTVEELLRLCHLFKIELEIYGNRGADSVSCFDRNHVTLASEEFLITLSVTINEKGWHQVEKDELKALKVGATAPYSPSLAFLHANQETKPIQERLSALQEGISTFLKTGILYVEGQNRRIKSYIGSAFLDKILPIHRLTIKGAVSTLKEEVEKKRLNVNEVTSNESLSLNYFISCTARNWTPLHLAVFYGHEKKVAALLALGANWRLKAKWEIKDKNLIVSERTFSQQVSALELAACLDNRQIVSLILKKALVGQDDKLVQEAYDGACNFKCRRSLYPFLEKKIKHSPQAMLNAIAGKDLVLAQALSRKGVTLPSAQNNEAGILQLSFKAANESRDLKYSTTLQNFLLLSLHQVRAPQLNNEALKVVQRALDVNMPEWVAHLVEYLERMPVLLNKEKTLVPLVMRYLSQIFEVIAKHACTAVSERSAVKFKTCLTADQRCLLMPGKDNPLHVALQHENYYFAKNTYADFMVESLQTLRDEKFDDEMKAKIRESARRHFNSFSDKAYDRSERTLSFRLERVERKEQIYRALRTSSFLQTVKLRSSLVAFNLKEAQIYCADKIFERASHTSKITQNPLYKYGYLGLVGVRTLGTLATAGPIKYGLNLAWHFLPSVFKAPILYTTGKVSSYVAPYFNASPEAAQFYVPLAAENIITFAFMPHYYVASTILGTGVYYTFKDSGYDNLEALAQLAADGLAFSWTTGDSQNYEVDDRYKYNLTKNLTPFLGEAWSKQIVPYVASVDTFSIGMNKRLNAPINFLSSYFSANALAQMQSFLGTSALSLETLPFSKEISDLVKKGYDSFQYLQFQKHLLGERTFNYLEEATLGLMGDSAFKTDRLHAIQAFETSALSYTVDELQKMLAETKKEGNAQAIDKVQKMLDSQSAALEKSKTQEERLFKKTEGYQYFESWQEKHVAMRYGEVDKTIGQAQLTKLKEEEQAALEKSKFYNSDTTNKAAEHWGKAIDDLFSKYQANFPDWTNTVGVAQGIVDSTFYSFSDRNQMAKYAADEIIRLKYPFYPDIGDSATIEAERQLFINEISTNELSGYKRNPGRSQDRLYDYVLAKLTNTEKPKHVHRHERILKPFINEILGKVVGWIPFKDFKGGRTNSGGVGIQYNKAIGGAQSVEVTLAGNAVYRVYDSNKKSKVLAALQKSLPSRTSSSDLSASQSVPSFSELTPETIRGMEIDNPYIVAIMDEMYDEVFGKEKEKQAKKVQPQRAAKNKKTYIEEAKKSTSVHKEESKSSTKVNISATHHNPHPRLAAFLQGVDESVIPVKDLPRLALETVKESYEDLVEGAVWMAKFAGREACRGAKGEELQTKKAIFLLGELIGEEAARLVLNEKTKTAQFVREVASEFGNMNKEERTKAIGKIALMFVMPTFGLGQVKRVAGIAQRVAGREVRASTKVQRLKPPVVTPIATAKIPSKQVGNPILHQFTYKTTNVRLRDLEPTHGINYSKNQFSKFVGQIQKEGIQDPVKYVVHHGQKYIVDGHHRYYAARRLNLWDVPAVEVNLPYQGYKTTKDLVFNLK